MITFRHLATTLHPTPMFAFAAFLLPLVAQAAPPAAPAQPSLLGGMGVPMVLFAVMMYYVIIRPQQKRTKDQQTLISSAKSGDEIVTTGGLHGIISNARDPESKTVLVKFAENVKIEVDKSAITGVIKAGAKAAAVPANKTA